MSCVTDLKATNVKSVSDANKPIRIHRIVENKNKQNRARSRGGERERDKKLVEFCSFIMDEFRNSISEHGPFRL